MEMLDQLLVVGLTSCAGTLIGTSVAVKILAVKHGHTDRRVEEHLREHQTLAPRLVYRDHCESCERLRTERQAFLNDKFETLGNRITALENALRTCFEDLADQLRGNKDE